jgi:flavin reductase (DIM6/NTAB) family NADH-FMN oxidoreductase RutF
MRHIEWYEETEALKKALSGDGVFVVAKDRSGKANPMTIGWGQVGIVWGLPVFTVLIRKSRYTHECIRYSNSFAVCVPTPGHLSEALQFCGTTSGRDIDKAAQAGMTLVAANKIDAPIIAECNLHYECEIIARSQQERDDFASDRILESIYKNGDHHLVVFGQIVEAYAKT